MNDHTAPNCCAFYAPAVSLNCEIFFVIMIENDLSLEFQAPTLAVTSNLNGNLNRDHASDRDAIAGDNESESDPSPSRRDQTKLLDVNDAFDRSQCQHLDANLFLFDVAILYENQPRLESESATDHPTDNLNDFFILDNISNNRGLGLACRTAKLQHEYICEYIGECHAKSTDIMQVKLFSSTL